MSLTTRCILLALILLCCNTFLHAKEEGLLSFVANKGQWYKQVRYKSDVQDGTVYFLNDRFRYDFYNPADIASIHDRHDDGPHHLRGHAYDVIFKGSKASSVEGSDMRRHYYNFFIGNDTSAWVSGVPAFQQVNYSNLYQAIDMQVYSNGTSIKYDLLVYPGGDMRNIQMQFDGVTPVVNENGDLVIKTSVNTIVEMAPYAYQVIDGVETTVPCRYVLSNNQLSFDFPSGYNHTQLLVIDPMLKFATYTGSTGQLWGYCATYDGQGNLYSGSEAFSTGFPVSTGAYQTLYKGNDIAINKYNATGDTLIYSTYCGGSTGSEYPMALTVNIYNELVVCGHTYSGDYPVTSSASDQYYNGAGDIILTVFNASGSALVGSTYVGGSGVEGKAAYAFHDNDENKVGLCTDPQGNIYVASSTQSKDIPVTPGAFQAVHGSTYDGCIFKFNRSCSSIIYCTYLGGNHIDCIYDCKLAGNNLVVCGRTRSEDFPLGFNAYSDTGNAFVSILSANGQFLSASTRLGLHTESALKIGIDDNNNIFVCGNNDTAFVPSAGAYFEPNGKIFIAKLTPGLSSMIRCTKLVAQNYPGVTGFNNICGDVVGTVLLKEMKPLPVTSNAYQSAPAAYYFYHLSPAMDTLIYATFYGAPNDSIKGGHAHGWSAVDTNGMVWLSTCNKDTKHLLPGTSGSYCPASISGVHNYDHLSAKFDMEVLPAKPLAKAVIPDTLCAKADVYFYNQSKNAYSYIWHFGDGDTSHAKNPVHRYDTPGYYRVKLEAYNLYSCRVVDSLAKTVFVDTNEIFSSFASVDTACIGNTVHFYNTSRNGISTLWDFGDGTTSTTSHGQHVYAGGGRYLVKLISYNPDFCNKTDTAFKLLTIDTAGPGANFTIPYTVACADKPQQFTNTTARGVSYQWSFGDGATSVAVSPTHVYTTGGKHTVRLVATNTKLCKPVDTAYNIIEILPPLQFDLADSFICGGNEPVRWALKLIHVNSNPTYRWEPANAVISGGGQPVAIVDPRIATKYYITVTDTIPGSCAHQRSDTAVLTIVDYPDSVVATSNSPVCEGDALLLKGTTSSNLQLLKYSWEGPDSYTASGQNAGRDAIARHQAGKYRVAISNQGCVSYAEADVTVKPKPKIEAGSNSPVWTGKELKLILTTDTPLDSFFWTGPMGFHSTEDNPILKPVVMEMAGSYAVRAWHDGCLSGDITLVKVSEVDSHYLRIYPNPSNGNFYIEGKGYHEQEIKMLIVNSIGQKLYRANVNTEKKHFKHHITMPPISDGVYIIWVLMDGEYKGLPFTVLSD